MSDLTIAVESTDDLAGTWSELTVDPADSTSTSLNTDFEQIQIVLRNTGDQQYVRLQFTLTNGGTTSNGPIVW